MSLSAYVIQSDLGLRIWQAEDVDHAIEQHRDAFPDEPVLGVGIAIKASSEWPNIKLGEATEYGYEYQRPETTEECEREMRRLSNGERGCQDPRAHERADRLARIAEVYPEAAAEAREL